MATGVYAAASAPLSASPPALKKRPGGKQVNAGLKVRKLFNSLDSSDKQNITYICLQKAAVATPKEVIDVDSLESTVGGKNPRLRIKKEEETSPSSTQKRPMPRTRKKPKPSKNESSGTSVKGPMDRKLTPDQFSDIDIANCKASDPSFRVVLFLDLNRLKSEREARQLQAAAKETE